MKNMKLFLMMVITNIIFIGAVNAQVCSYGGDYYPWSTAKPFPWENVQGAWQMGEDKLSIIKIIVVNENAQRKQLKFYLYNKGACSRYYAKGAGYVDSNEKNTVRGVVNDTSYNYLLRLGLFNSSDLMGAPEKATACPGNIMGLSMQVIGSKNPALSPVTPEMMEETNIVLKKISNDVSLGCKRYN